MSETPAMLLLPYQNAWIADRAQVKVIEKSRQIGITWAEAADAALDAAKKSGSDWWYVGYNREMALEFVETAAEWARHFQRAASKIEEFVFKDEDGQKDILAYRIRFASGQKIVALSSRPSNLRGKHGKVIIDEAAFHDDLKELLKAALALTIWGGSVHVISTHNGIDNRFNELVQDIRSGRLPYSLHSVTFDQALADGLYHKICQATEVEWTAQRETAWRKEIFDRYGDNADEELNCQPRSKAGSWLPYDLILTCEDRDAGKPELYKGGNCWIGNDIGRRRDLWVAWVVELVGDVLWTREVVEMKGATFAVQDAQMDALMRRYKVLRLAMDQTGMGEKPVEDAQRRYVGRVDGVLFTPPVRISIASIGKRAFEDRRLRIPAERGELRGDLHKPRMEVGPTGTPRLTVEHDEDGHADRFWALMLALAAADPGKYPPPEIFFGRDDDDMEDDEIGATSIYARRLPIGRSF